MYCLSVRRNSSSLVRNRDWFLNNYFIEKPVVVTELVLIECELRASCWPDRELGDGDEELDKPLGHVGEHSILTAAASHLQK